MGNYCSVCHSIPLLGLLKSASPYSQLGCVLIRLDPQNSQETVWQLPSSCTLKHLCPISAIRSLLLICASLCCLGGKLHLWASLLMSLGRCCCVALGTMGTVKLVLSTVYFSRHLPGPCFKCLLLSPQKPTVFPCQMALVRSDPESYGAGQVSPFQSVPILELSPSKLLSEMLSTAHSTYKMGAVHMSLTGLLQNMQDLAQSFLITGNFAMIPLL